jgi:hypothetical protein
MVVNRREWDDVPYILWGEQVLARLHGRADGNGGRLDTVAFYNGDLRWSAELALSVEDVRAEASVDLGTALGFDPYAARTLLDQLQKEVAKADAESGGPVQPFTSLTAAEQMRKEVTPPLCSIKGLLYGGLTLLVGGPKLGKSIILLDMGLRIAAGLPVLGRLPATRTEVLYLVLEDGEGRTQDRMRQMLDGREAPDGLHLVYEAESLGPRLVKQLDLFIDDHPAVQVVFIDTLARARAGATTKPGASVFQLEYDQGQALHDWAGRRDVCLAVAHHTRKQGAEDVVHLSNSTQGLPAVADNTLTFQRIRGERRATLTPAGRDVDEREYVLQFQAETRTYTLLEGEELADELARAEEEALNPTRKAIVDALRRADAPRSLKELARMTGLNWDLVKKTVYRMVEDRQVFRASRGQYALNTLVETEPMSSPDPLDDDDEDDEAPTKPQPDACPACAATSFLWLPEHECWFCTACGWGHPEDAGDE